MRSFATIAAAATLLSSVHAAPWGNVWGNKDPGKCLTTESAQYLVNGFGGLISAYTDADAEKLLADDLTDYSDSINSLIGAPVGSVTFPSKAAFMAGQGAQPPVPFQVLAIEAVNCDTVAFRWLGGLQPEPVKGITILTASNAQGQKDTWQIKTIYSEFNSISWLKDIGGSVTLPSQ
ncbi:uncharacterized protein Z518_07891 [Rhinocladiella mackenziei CBS 650.93]|uniref:NTF2-like domain-containing protein n=1 Tax=Rhinocladiella mackenziei CBS 650.93 TaxID=1442369 RepID=A0A0D2FIZ4_9EURO|nr:uncharacterized protein Z518_07891 [Rhinocladiella mackenziei CBS 650.93]KIX01952.1 hypothetical protein Z518_07891 [Rhinocladiella mackenziei CBS 650.93]